MSIRRWIRFAMVFAIALPSGACVRDRNPSADLVGTTASGAFRESPAASARVPDRGAVATASQDILTIVRVVASSGPWYQVSELARYPIIGLVKRPEPFWVRTDIDLDRCPHWRLAVYAEGDAEPPAGQNCAWGLIWRGIEIKPSDACYPPRDGHFLARVTCAEDQDVVALGRGDMAGEETRDPREMGCLESGGEVITASCCLTIDAFPNGCLVGACGCGPGSSHDVLACACPPGKCFNGATCVP
jgi:hypothetical protein